MATSSRNKRNTIELVEGGIEDKLATVLIDYVKGLDERLDERTEKSRN